MGAQHACIVAKDPLLSCIRLRRSRCGAGKLSNLNNYPTLGLR